MRLRRGQKDFYFKHEALFLEFGQFLSLLVGYALLMGSLQCQGWAQENGDPRICVVAPVGIVIGTNSTVTLRGLKLADATQVSIRASGQLLKATIKEKKTVDIPTGLVAKDVGDSLVVVDVVVPPNLVDAKLSISVTTLGGTTPPFSVPLIPAEAFTLEKEPNHGFQTAQQIKFGTRVIGAIQADKDVDVFTVSGHSEKTLVVEVVALREGSLLDGLLTLYDSQGRVLATNDDQGEVRDPLVRFKLPADGTYFLVVQDANDRGTLWHGYELRAREEL